MKLKIFLIFILCILLLISIIQIFTIPPYAKDIYPVYKSGYFKELEKGFDIIKGAFLGIKSKKIIKFNLAQPEYAWIYLQDVARDHNIIVKVYDNSAREVTAPGIKENEINHEVLTVLNSESPGVTSRVEKNNYYSIIPLKSSQECTFCHKKMNKRDLIGALTFLRKYDATVYYTSERIIIFIFISIILLILIYLLLRWEPHRNIKELFDKK